MLIIVHDPMFHIIADKDKIFPKVADQPRFSYYEVNTIARWSCFFSNDCIVAFERRRITRAVVVLPPR